MMEIVHGERGSGKTRRLLDRAFSASRSREVTVFCATGEMAKYTWALAVRKLEEGKYLFDANADMTIKVKNMNMIYFRSIAQVDTRGIEIKYETILIDELDLVLQMLFNQKVEMATTSTNITNI